jgi:putative membrane protein
LLFGVAYAQWKRHRYAFVGDALGVRRGVIKRRIWLLPVSKMQVFYTTDSYFQRRRGLKSVYVDSAGAASVSRPVIIDLERADADELVRQLYARFVEQE